MCSVKKIKILVVFTGISVLVVVFFIARSREEDKKFINLVKINDSLQYQRFLDSYPRGKHADEVKARIRQLDAEENACKEDTINSYREILRKYPQGRLENYAPLRIKYLEHFQSMATPKTVKIIITLMKAGMESELKKYGDNFWSDTKKIFEAVGVKVVDSNADKFDSQLLINVNGTADGATYTPQNYTGSTKFLYTAADISGEIVFRTGRKSINKSFSGKADKPETVAGSSMFDQEREAPFSTAYFKSNYISRILEIVDEVYGLESYVQCFVNLWDKRNMEEAIVDKGSPVVDYLVGHLKDKDAWRVIRIVDVLGKIGDKRAVDNLIIFLQNRELRVGQADVDKARRDSLDRSASKYPDHQIVVLDPVLNSKITLKAAIIRALGLIGDRRAVGVIASALEDNAVKNEAADALALITKEGLLKGDGNSESQDVSKWQKWWKDNMADYQAKK